MFQANFKAEQSLDGKTLRITDISNYASPDDISNISARSLSLLKYDATALQTPNPFDFPIDAGLNDFIDIPVDKDYALDMQMSLTPVVAQVDSVYSKTISTVLLNFSKAKLYDREARLIAGLIVCTDSYADVNYSIIRWTDDAYNRSINSDQLGAQRYLDKINSIGINDCVC